MKDQNGSVPVFITLMVVLLVILVGRGLKIGGVTYTSVRESSAVDAAVLSGVSSFALGDAAEGLSRVSSQKNSGYNAVASATTESMGAGSVVKAIPTVPIALRESVCQGAATVTKSKIDRQSSCWTSYLNESSSANNIEALFTASGSCAGVGSGAIDIGTPIFVNSGQAANVYSAAEQLFMIDHPKRCWIIPVIEGSGKCSAKEPVPITDWAKLCPTAVSKKGAHSYIQANVACKQSIHETRDNLCFSYR